MFQYKIYLKFIELIDILIFKKYDQLLKYNKIIIIFFFLVWILSYN
jgi:hypothetical protein